MRKALLIASVGLALLQGVPSQAATLASCSKEAGLNGVPQNVSVGGVCGSSIPIEETTAARIRLTPGAGFTGVLTARVTSTQHGGISVTGFYVAGELVNGMSEETIVLVHAPGADWRLTVAAGEPTPTSTYLFPPLPGQADVPGVAFGSFGAEVVPDAGSDPGPAPQG